MSKLNAYAQLHLGCYILDIYIGLHLYNNGTLV